MTSREREKGGEGGGGLPNLGCLGMGGGGGGCATLDVHCNFLL